MVAMAAPFSATLADRYPRIRVMIGTDYPFGIMDTDPHGSVDALGLAETSAALIREGNARRFFGID